MKVIVAGLQRADLVKHIRKQYPTLRIVRTQPDFILCYGGDGTLLYAERVYPGVPKVMIRHSRVCHNCARMTRDTILTMLTTGKYELIEHPLIEAKVRGKIIYGLNDIIIGHATINTSVRYNVYLDDAQYGGEYLGDGVIVATPLGSTGYYQSITHSTFQEGLGIAFNNTVNNIGHLVVASNTEVKVKVNRGPALVVADNAKVFHNLDKGQTTVIRQSHRSTYIAYFKGKHYRQYNIGVGENRVPLGYCQICSKAI